MILSSAPGAAGAAHALPAGDPYTDVSMPAAQAPALILAAGRGERMRPLTDACPKPLLRVQGKALIEWHLEALACAGVRDVVVNTAWLEEQFPAALGDGSRWGLRIRYSAEGRDHGGALETAGGIANALPLLELAHDGVFWVVSGDVFLPGFDFDPAQVERFMRSDEWAHLWLAANAAHHPEGDFGIDTATGLATRQAPQLTWVSVGLFRSAMFEGILPGERLALRPRLDATLAAGRLGAQHWPGPWTDVGTAERLHALNALPGTAL